MYFLSNPNSAYWKENHKKITQIDPNR